MDKGKKEVMLAHCVISSVPSTLIPDTHTATADPVSINVFVNKDEQLRSGQDKKLSKKLATSLGTGQWADGVGPGLGPSPPVRSTFLNYHKRL